VDTVNSATEAIPDPHRPIRASSQRKHLLVAQAIVSCPILPLAIRISEKTACSASPDCAIASFGYRPDAGRRQFDDASELSVGPGGREKACLCSNPKPFVAIEAQSIGGFANEALAFAEPLHSAGSWIEPGGSACLSADP
jgi:hypothetical protein